MAKILAGVLLTFALCVAAPTAFAQRVHTPRNHAEPPLRGLFPEALPAPPTPIELGEQSSGEPSWSGAPDGGYEVDDLVFTAHVDPEGRVTMRDKGIEGNVIITPLFIAFAGIIDVTDLVSRWLGEDPYWYRKKAFLESTFGERLAMRRDHAEATMIRAIAHLPAYLEAIWSYPAFSLEQRKQILFALWDECAEDGNELMRLGGAEARKLILTFIQQHAPPSSPAAYTSSELRRLNGLRTAQLAFAPYAPVRPIEQNLIARRTHLAAATELALTSPRDWQLGISQYTHSDEEYCHQRKLRLLDR